MSPDTPGRSAGRRRWIYATTAVLLVAFLATLAWWVDLRHDQGWVGLSYYGHEAGEPEMRAVPLVRSFMGEPGEIHTVHPGSPAARAGLDAGERILAIDDIPIRNQERLETLAEHARRGDTVTYRVLGRGGTVRLVPVELGSPFRMPSISANLAVSILVGLGYLLVSLLVLRSRPRSAQALVFYLLCATGALFFLLLGFAEVDLQNNCGIRSNFTQNPRIFAILTTFLLLGLVVGNLLIHLILIFPRRRPLLESRPQTLRWLHSLPFLPALVPVALFTPFVLLPGSTARWFLAAASLLLAAGLGRRLLRRRREGRLQDAVLASPFAAQGLALALLVALSPLLRLLPEQVAISFSALLLAGTVATYMILVPLLYGTVTLLLLVRSYREARVEEKRQLRWPLWGTAMALGLGTLLYVVTSILAGIDPQGSQEAWWGPFGSALFKLLNLLIPVSFAFAIAKYRLMDIDWILRKTAVYATMSAFVVAGYLVLVGGVGLALLAWTRVENQVVAVVATLVLAALFVPVRTRVQGVVDRRFGRGGPDPGQALEQVRRLVVGSPDLESLLTPVAETVQQALGTRTLVLFVQPPDGRSLTARAKVGLPDEVLGRLSLPPAALEGAGRVAQVRDLPALEGDGDDRETLRRVRAELVAPARRQGRVVGAVVVGRKLDGSETGADERELLAAVADQLSLAVGSLGPRREALELDQARVLQRSLLPDRVPSVPGLELEAVWSPAREVAGDYYDVLELGDGRLALCIGDVAGKGMAAALLMSSLQAAVRAVAASDVPPERVCEQVRRVVCQNLSGGRFVTFFYSVLDLPERRLAWCNAGHAPPLLARADGGVEWLETGGGAFARLLAHGPLVGAEVALAPGDRLVLYTDGVTEARREGGEMLGDEGLVERVRSAGDGSGGGPTPTAAQTTRHLVAAVADHSGPEAADDVTLLVARLVDTPPGDPATNVPRRPAAGT